MEQTSFHPGEHIQEELNAMGMSAAEFAAKLGVSDERLESVLQGKQNVDAEFAMRLAHFFGMSPQFWLNLQLLFDLEAAGQKYGAEIESLPTLQAA